MSMYVTALKSQVLTALTEVATALPRKTRNSARPVRLITREGQLSIEAGCRVYDNSKNDTVAGASAFGKVESPGSIVVNYDVLLGWIKSLPKHAPQLGIGANATALSVSCGNSTLSLSALPDKVPGIPKMLEYARLRFRVEKLFPTLGTILPCVDANTSRQALSRVLMEWGEGGIRLVGSDGHRLAISECPFAGVEAQEFKPALLSPLPLGALRKIIGKAHGNSHATLDLGESWYRVTLDSVDIYGRVDRDSRYPEYPRIINPVLGTAPILVVDRDAMLTALADIKGAVSAEVYAVILEGGAGNVLNLSLRSPHKEGIVATTKLQIEGIPSIRPIAFNYGFLAHAVDNSPPGRLEFRNEGPRSPMAVGQNHIIMPMAII